jgi:hypothetical protein
LATPTIDTGIDIIDTWPFTTVAIVTTTKA